MKNDKLYDILFNFFFYCRIFFKNRNIAKRLSYQYDYLAEILFLLSNFIFHTFFNFKIQKLKARKVKGVK